MSAPPERIDVSDLPEYAFGHRSTLWWGTGGFIVIEATAFALALFGYFYLRSKLPEWPPGVAPPDLLWGTLNTGVLLASAVPNQWAKNAAEAQQLGRVRLWLVVCLAFGVVFLAIRGFEFTTLNCAWAAMPTARSSGRSWACTRPICSPTSSIRACSRR